MKKSFFRRREHHSTICDALHTDRYGKFTIVSSSTPPQRACFTLSQSTNSLMHDYPPSPRPTRRSCLFFFMVPQTVVTQGNGYDGARCQRLSMSECSVRGQPLVPTEAVRVPHTKRELSSRFKVNRLRAFLLPLD